MVGFKSIKITGIFHHFYKMLPRKKTMLQHAKRGAMVNLPYLCTSGTNSYRSSQKTRSNISEKKLIKELYEYVPGVMTSLVNTD
ncbi:MAG: hypothetical protein CSA04_00775 [Bacteroidetes bacterium]|nr:MAG: hypothetical protein CSA04_00775 [Bacteroidota bacterium]